MAAPSQFVKIPAFAQVVQWNKLLVAKYGGLFTEPDNVLNPGSLRWVLQVVEYPVFGYDPYPTAYHKVAIIAWTIITGHVFHDGNKRTGMFAAGQILLANGLILKASSDEIVTTALAIATHRKSKMTLELLAEWCKNHSTPQGTITR